jgi:exodeoxyribonuclease III
MIERRIETIRRNVHEGYRIIQWNANGIRARIKKGAFIKFIQEENPDILMVSEFRCDLKTFFRAKGVESTLQRLGYKYNSVHISSDNIGYGGVAIFSKIKPLTTGSGVDDAELDKEGRLTWMEFEKFRLFEIYSPNSGKPGNLRFLQKRIRFEKALSKRIQSLNDKPRVLCGDLNVARLENDVYGGLSHPRWRDFPACTDIERGFVEKLMSDNELVDVQGHLKMLEFSYFRSERYKIRGEGMRLDYVLVPSTWWDTKMITDFSVRKDVRGSDHIPHEFRLAKSLFGSKGEGETLAAIAEQTPTQDRVPAHIAQAMHDALTDKPFETFFSIKEDGVLDTSEDDAMGEEQVAHWTSIRQWFNDPESGYTEATETRFMEEVHNIEPKKAIILPTVDVEIEGVDGIPQVFRSLVDSGASSSIANYEMLLALLGTERMKASLITDGHLPRFRCADGRITTPVGRAVLRFRLQGQEFHHVFYVMKSCAQPLILGGDFMADTDTVISYKRGHIRFTSNLGVRVSCPFDTHKGEPTGRQRASVLFATEDCVIPPRHSLRIQAEVDKNDQIRLDEPWGLCENHEAGSRTTIPRSCTRLKRGRTLLVVSNLRSSESVTIDAGQAVAVFAEADRNEFQEYAIDLEKLGIDDNPFREIVYNSAELVEAQCSSSAASDDESDKDARRVRSMTPTELKPAPIAKSHASGAGGVTAGDACGWTTGPNPFPVASRSERVRCEGKIPTQGDGGGRGNASHPPLDHGNVSAEQQGGSRCAVAGKRGGKPFVEWVASACEDRCEPFSPDDVDSVHLPRIPKNQLEEMSEEQIAELFCEPPLNRIVVKPDLSAEQKFTLRKVILSNRDLFAKNDKKPGTVNAAGCSITVKPGAKPQCFPMRPTLPNARP